MLQSMTGYGYADRETDKFLFSAEIKTLNSKGLDLNVRLPRAYSDKELEVRNLVTQALDRGKISVYVDAAPVGQAAVMESIDKDIIAFRYQTLRQSSQNLGIDIPEIELFKMAFQWPASVQPTAESNRQREEETDWPTLQAVVKAAVEGCKTFRLDEGKALEAKLLEYNATIRKRLSEIIEQETLRLPKVRQRLEEKLEEVGQLLKLDNNRLEQEMVFFLEKLDIQEEIVRLTNHLNYFEQTILADPLPGKKIGFISQEMGREINTIGSKANDHTLQVMVVSMKEELEKIKEQSANIL